MTATSELEPQRQNFRDNGLDKSLPVLLFKLVEIASYFLPTYQVNRKTAVVGNQAFPAA